jgi:hypothetical protein
MPDDALQLPARHGAEIFWSELAPCEHLVQFYDSDGTLLDALESFVAAGIANGEGVALIATPGHLNSLRRRLVGRGLDLIAAENEDRYIALTAKEALSEFLFDGWPDETLFRNLVMRILHRAGAGGRRVRAFGEMVAVLWAQGNSSATMRLERLWQQLCGEQAFSVFCAYPKGGFDHGASDSIRDICAAHSRVVHGPA